MKPLMTMLVLAIAPALAEAQTLDKGHRILLERGMQIQAQCFYVPSDIGLSSYKFDPKPYLEANYTGVNWHSRPKDPDFAPANFPWARWTGSETDLTPAEKPFKKTLVALQYKDENSLDDAGVRADFKSWFDAARPNFPDTILYTNQLAFNSSDANLAAYMRECKPDMLCMDSYRFKIGNVEGTWNLFSDMQRYRKWALRGNDGSGKRPIPYALFPQVFHGEDMWRDPSESENRLNHFAAWALGYTVTFDFTFNYGSTALFTPGHDTHKPTAIYRQIREINPQGKNLGPALVRLVSRDVIFVPGEHKDAGGKVVVNATPIDMLAYPGGLNDATKDPHIRGVEGVRNLGKKNHSLKGDVLISWFNVIDESLDGPAEGEWYFMVTNALVDPTGAAADCRQEIQINFDETSPQFLQRLNREIGRVEDVAIQAVPHSDRRRLTCTLDGGTADLFKFKTDAPFVGAAK